MCEWGTTTVLRVQVPARLSHTGALRWKDIGVDSCIAPIVQALNVAHIWTVASCCGHGKQPGVISLEDGRELMVAPDFETARAIGRAFPPIFEENPVEVLRPAPPGPPRPPAMPYQVGG